MGGAADRLRLDPSLIPPGSLPGPAPTLRLTRGSLLGPEEGSAALDGFALGSASLTADHETRLTDLAVPLTRLLAEPRGGRINAVGHTDRVGTEERNATLGRQRAEAVKAGLIRQGIDAGDIHTYSLGESVPVVETPRPEPRNRRVHVYFAPSSGPDLSGVLSPGPTPPPLGPTPTVPDLTPRLRYCDLFPEECAPDRPPRDLFAPAPERPEQRLPPLTEMIWGPIDRSLERGLRRLGITGEWNQRLRDAARGGAERGATALLDQAMDAANLTGETREAVSAALRAAAQQRIPFP